MKIGQRLIDLIPEHYDGVISLKSDHYSDIVSDDHTQFEPDLYFECESCKKLHDSDTKSFQKLIDSAGQAGWKLVWNSDGFGYKVFCEECKE